MRGNSNRIQHRRGTASQWTVTNPVLLAGELGYETDTTRLKFGDGGSQWSALPYVGAYGSPDLEGLTDVSITSPATGAILRYDGSVWTDYVLAKADLQLGNVDNTSDLNKPISTATQAALDGKASTSDSRLSDARVPTDLSVTTAKIADGAVTTAKLADGAVATIDIATSAVTYAKIQNVSATDRILGRSTAGAGVVEEIVCTSFGRSLIDDADAATSRTTLGLGSIATQAAGSVAITGGTINGTSVGSTTASTGAFTTLTATGNVGIGTNAPGSRLEVIPGGGQGINCLNNGGAGTTNYAVMAQATGAASFNTGLYVNAYNATFNYGVRIVNPSSGASNWAIYSDATAQSYFAGSVGIGTAIPGQKLHVAGSGQGVFIEDTGANRAVLSLTASNTELRIQGTAYVNASQPLTIWTSNLERMRISETGQVGIGTTSPDTPLTAASLSLSTSAGTSQRVARFVTNVGNANLLDITNRRHTSGLDWGGTNIRLGRTVDATLMSFIDFGIDGVAGSMGMSFGTGGTGNRVVINDSGNVGIATASPTISSGVGLHIGGSTMRLDTARTPASSTATGNTGEHCWDSNYFYVCVATNSWKRIALSSF